MPGNLLQDTKWKVNKCEISSCKLDWQCEQPGCGHLNDPTAEQCQFSGCKHLRPETWKACGKSIRLQADNVVVTVGNGSLDEVMLKPCGQEVGAWIPIDQQNMLSILKIENVEPTFGVRVMVVDGADHSAGNFVCFHTQMFNHESLATALNNEKPTVGRPVKITYNAEIMSTMPGNIQMEITLEPVKTMHTSRILKQVGLQFSRSAKELSINEINDVVERANERLLKSHKSAIQLDSSEMAIHRTANQDEKVINRIPEAHRHRSPLLCDAFIDERARQEVEESIQLKDKLMPSGYALMKMSVDMLQEKCIELFLADLDHTAQHCVAKLQDVFAKDGSNSEQLLEHSSGHFQQNQANNNVYAYDRSETFNVAICPYTGNEILTLQTAANGENQRDGCTPSALHKIQQLREKKIQSILEAVKNTNQANEADLSSLLFKFNQALMEIWHKPNDCEDGAAAVAKLVMIMLHVCDKMQQAKSMAEKETIHESCVGQTVNVVTSHNVYTAAEREDLRTGIRQLWLHMSYAIGDIDKVGKPMVGLWFAGGASQSLQNKEQSNENKKNDANEVISFENENNKIEIIAVQAAGHAAFTNAEAKEIIATKKVRGVGTVNTYIQQKKFSPFETTASYFQQDPGDIYDATNEVRKDVYCQNEQDAMQVKQMEIVGKMLGQTDANNIVKLNRDAANGWNKIVCNNVLEENLGVQVQYKPCIPEPEAMAFYVAALGASLYDEQTGESAPCVSVDTATKLANRSSMGKDINDSMHVIISHLTIENEILRKYAALQRRYSNAHGPGNAEAKLKSRLLRDGPPLLGRMKKFGNPKDINNLSLGTVYLEVTGAVSVEQLRGDTPKTVSSNIEKIANLSVKNHAAPLLSITENKWGALVIAESTKKHVVMTNTKAYPQPLND